MIIQPQYVESTPIRTTLTIFEVDGKNMDPWWMGDSDFYAWLAIDESWKETDPIDNQNHI